MSPLSAEDAHDSTDRRAGVSLSAKLSIASNVAVLGAIAAVWFGPPITGPLPYTAHKFMHILGVVMFMGNLVAGPLWLWFARYADEGRHYAFAARTIADADIWLTTPGVQLTAWNGLFLAGALGGAQAQPWLVEALVLLVVSSLFGVVVVLPLQERMIAAAQTDDDTRKASTLISWSIWGAVIMIPFSVAAWLMVSKAALILG